MIKKINTLLILLFISGFTTVVFSADIEIFSTNENPDPPNVLFAIDVSGSMLSVIPNTGGKTRMEILQKSLSHVLAQNYKALNIGVMDFKGSSATGIDFPVVDINGDAHDIDSDIPKGTKVSKVISYIIDSYEPTSNPISSNARTPLGDAIYRAYYYYSGGTMRNPDHASRKKYWDDSLNRYDGGDGRADHPATIGNPVYYKPLPDSEELRNFWCSKDLSLHSINGRHSCHNPKSQNLKCTSHEGTAAYCKLSQKVCDSSNNECNYITVESVMATGAIDPDGDGDEFTVQCYDATPDYEKCRHDVPETIDGYLTKPNYVSPIVGQCQSNYLVILGDGEPTAATTQRETGQILDPSSSWATYPHCDDLSEFGKSIGSYGKCYPELTKHLREVDLAPDIIGDQTVTTYTVGFALDGDPKAQDYLKLLSDEDHGQGKYFDANSPAELVSVFQEIINEVVIEERSFVSPLVTVAEDNRLATSETVYLSSFIPTKKTSWKGEVTRYKVGTSGFDTQDGFNLSSVLSNNRTVYTYTSDYPLSDDVDLTLSSHRVSIGNTALSSSLLGISDDDAELRNNIIHWARGADVNDEDDDENTSEASKHMGDSLHSKPAIVNYSDSRQVLYNMTNDGFLHAFDVSKSNTPYEIFSFIPQALLKNLQAAYKNSNSEKMYGLDGGITVWKTQDKVILILGMRRGGRNYYALDVTIPESPKLKWVIQGGDKDSEFENLGQTWSTPLLTKVKYDHKEVMALIFGGGYDTNQDSNLKQSDDDMGNAVYVVNAKTGKHLWSAGEDDEHELQLSKMEHSIPSNIRAIDFDGDGYTNRLYFGDTGGNVWRIDLNTDDIEDSTGYQLADFNDETKEGNRRFYYAPSVAISRKGKLKLSIGSGYRAHPLAQGVQDRLYVFEDENAAIEPPSHSQSILTESDLDKVGKSSGESSNWYVNLADNEKALSESLIFDNKVVFTTYQPKFTGDGGLCDSTSADTKAYYMKLSNGDSAIRQQGNKRSIPLQTKNIPDSPFVVFNKSRPSTFGVDTDLQVADIYVGKKKIGQIGSLNERLYWKKDK